MLKPSPGMIKDLRRRHKITQVELADSLYGIKRDRIREWESSTNPRRCPAIVWWAMVLTWDKKDLWVKKGDLNDTPYTDKA